MQRAFAAVRRRSGVDADLDQLKSRIEDASLRIHEASSRIDEARLGSMTEAADLRSMVQATDETLKPAAAWAELLFGVSWARLAPLSEEPLVSVVLPTSNRSTLVRRAIESVFAQTYPKWELIVVNDGSTDNTQSVIEELRDDRVRPITGDGSGAAHARNIGLREAAGSIITFLDDDNLMAPDWLRAVVVTFERRSDLNAVYGAQLRSRERHVAGDPFLMFEAPFDFEHLMEINFIDLGTVAHRSGLQGLSFDESLTRLIDWDYVVRLADRFGIEPLPVVAGLYTTDAPMRIHTAVLTSARPRGFEPASAEPLAMLLVTRRRRLTGSTQETGRIQQPAAPLLRHADRRKPG
jgi:Glycosyl transferase family 2